MDMKKYYKVSIWLAGGGKIIKEINGENLDSLDTLIGGRFRASMEPAYSNKTTPFIRLENLTIKCTDISAIDIEEKTVFIN